MIFFLRYFLPITYFQSTRLNRWVLVGYNGLVEWAPAIVLSLYFSDLGIDVFRIVLLSYLAFICIYEIGYITNDFLSERVEAEPRGRIKKLQEKAGAISIAGLIVIRLGWFILFSWLLGALSDPRWLTFHIAMAATFGLHNFLPSKNRMGTFFCLSTFRFFAPVILSLGDQTLFVLLPAILLNNSLYRTIVYISGKNTTPIPDWNTVRSKVTFYLTCLPLSVLFAVLFWSVLPVGVCLYFILVWFIYSVFGDSSTNG